jgi:DNA polymerase-4
MTDLKADIGARPLKWLFLDLNSYFASVEQQANPMLRGKPVAVVPMMTDSTCAIAASYEAKAYGIKTGTMIYEAKKLCPDLVCVHARHDLYVDYHHRIFGELENHLHVTRICSIDEAACLLLGKEREPDKAIRLARQIKQGIWDNVGEAINCSIGIAPNRYLAKIASDMNKPNGLTVLRDEDLPAPLFDLKLTDLTGINVNMERRLNRSGIYSVEKFYNLSPKHARSVWGSVGGERLWYQLHGYDVEEPKTKKRVVGHSRVLEPVSRHPDRAYAVIRRLTVKAASRLRRYDLYASELALKVRTPEGRRWASAIRFEPADDNFTFLNALQNIWELMSAELQPDKLMKVAISIYNLCEAKDITHDLFSVASKDRQEIAVKNKALSDAMDNINSKYGNRAVQLGLTGKDDKNVGTKIAFTRIPEAEEFRE